MSPHEIATRICEHLDAGSITRREAEILIGFVLVETLEPSDEFWLPKSTYYRRCKQLRPMGLLKAAETEPVNVDF